MPKLILCRHGETIYNLQKRYQGHIDIPLSETGLSQAEELRERLASVHFDAVYTSDLQRAINTAKIVLHGHPTSLTIQSTPLLREIDGGDFEGLTWDEIKEHFPQAWELWQADRASNAPPNGENLYQVEARLEKALAEIVEAHPKEEDTILLVVHGGVVCMILSHLFGMDLNHLWQWRVDNCSVTILDLYQQGAILSLFNDTAHIQATALATP